MMPSDWRAAQLLPATASLQLPLEAEVRTEMSEGTIVKCDLLGVSAAI